MDRVLQLDCYFGQFQQINLANLEYSMELDAQSGRKLNFVDGLTTRNDSENEVDIGHMSFSSPVYSTAMIGIGNPAD